MIYRILLMSSILAFFPYWLVAQSASSNNSFPSSGVAAIASTTSASFKLSINGAVKQYGTGFNSVTSPSLFLENSTATTGRHFGINSSDNGLFRIVDITASNADRFVINSSGNIGVGTSSPTNKLQVEGTVQANADRGFRSVNGGNTWFFGSNAGDFQFTENSMGTRLVIKTGTGKIGIGTLAPDKLLHVNSPTPIRFSSGTSDYFDIVQNSANIWSFQGSSGGSNVLTMNNATGAVSIGTTTAGPFKLTVEGTIGTRKIKVTQLTAWADYVFDDNYNLPSLEQLERFIKQNKHLPDVPSTAQVEKYGLDLGDNQVLLLKKIEELTLYMIQQNKKIESLEKMNVKQQQEIDRLKNPQLP